MRGFSHAMRAPSESEDDRKPKVIRTYARLLGYARPYRRRIIILCLLALVTSLISVLPYQLFGIAINELRGEAKTGPRSKLVLARPTRALSGYARDRWFAEADPTVVMMWVLGGVYLVLHCGGTLLSVVHGFCMAKVGQGVVYDMRNEVYSHVQRLSLRFFDEQKTGDLMSRIVNDVNSLQQVIVDPVVGLMVDMCRLVWVLYFCLRWDALLTVCVLLVAPVQWGCTLVFGKYIRRAFRELRAKVGELNALTQDNLSGIRVIQGFSREEHERGRFDEKNLANFRQNVHVARLFATLRPVVDFLIQSGTVVALVLGGYRVATGALSLGTFVVFLPYLRMLYGPIMGMTRFYNHIQRAVASVERVFEVLDVTPDLPTPRDAKRPGRIEGRVEFRDVSFSYDDDAVLADISFEAQPGQMIALVGPSGAGKTTLTNLIPRFYDPSFGGVFVDGHNLKDVDLRWLREQMALVLQDPFLFNDTIKANIAYGKLDAPDQEVVAAARAANAHVFVEKLQDRYETSIGERGVRLSGGEKQRLAIARAILANPRVLILDEATSSLDTETERLIQDAIQRLVKDRTTFVIAHRLSTVLHADRILVLDRGRIVEQGPHEELLRRDGLYAKLHRLQFRVGDERPEPETDRPGRPSEPPELPSLTDEGDGFLS